MDIRHIKTVWVTAMLLIVCLAGGCGGPVRTGKKELSLPTELGTTIGSLVAVLSPESIRVEGYGLVGRLSGTGSAECPPQIRKYLERYILREFPERKIDVEKVIRSRDTAVVQVEGIMPVAVSKNESFDVRVTALPVTQTTSLDSGWLYSAELYEGGKFGVTTKVLATAKGPVFIDTINPSGTDKKIGYILGGGRVLDEYKIILALRRPDYRIASLIQNRLNARWDGTAKAVSHRQIELKAPAEYAKQKQRFISIVKATYLTQTREITKERIRVFVGKLASSADKYSSEISLEAIGNACVKKLSALLNSSDEEVRLRAARCMLNLGSDVGLDTLRKIAIDKDSTYRVEALEAIATGASRNYAASISRRLLRDGDFEIRLAAYEQLRKFDDIAVTQKLIARSFYLEQTAATEQNSIFVSRSGQPRIVLFGSPISCSSNIFVESADGNITINAPAGQKYVSVMRKDPKQPTMIGPLRSSFELGDIIQTLCEEPAGRSEGGQGGLGVSYADMIALLKQMCKKGVVGAEFRAGPLPKNIPIIKK